MKKNPGVRKSFAIGLPMITILMLPGALLWAEIDPMFSYTVCQDSLK